MEFAEFQKFIDDQVKRYRTGLGADLTERERILLNAVKVSEEFGELSNEVLANLGRQSNAKLRNHTKESLADEFADVIIAIFILAKSLNVSIPDALIRKIPRILEKRAMKENSQN